MLFDGDDASMNFNFYNKAGAIQTKDYFFEAVNKTDSSVTMRLAADSASYIDFIYTLKPDSYLMNFEIKATGMEDKLASTKYVDIDWSQRARQLEKGFTYENRLSELTYKVTGDNVDNLSAAKDDSQDLPGRIDWVAFKNQFFSSVFIAEQDFDKVSVKSKMEQQGSGYIKDYSAEMNTFFDPSGKEPTEMHFYFGPNHFKTLKALDKGRDEKWELHRLVYLGWPLIRWINQFITINVFDWLSGWGLSMGIVLLILTIMVKSRGLSGYLENVHVYCQDACTETENRRNQQEISEAGRCNEETAGGDGSLQPIRGKPDGRLSADVIAVPYLDGFVYVRAECYRAASTEFLVGG